MKRDVIRTYLISLKVKRGGGCNRLVLLEDAHYSCGPVGHVFGYHEGEMTALYLFVVEYGTADSVSGPLGICGISELIGFSFKHGDWDLDVL
jgi:hypothetical protein